MDTRIDPSLSTVNLAELLASASPPGPASPAGPPTALSPLQPAAARATTGPLPDAFVANKSAGDSLILDRLPPPVSIAKSTSTILNPGLLTPDTKSEAMHVITTINDRTAVIASNTATAPTTAAAAGSYSTVDGAAQVSVVTAAKLATLEDLILFKLNPVVVEDPGSPPVDPPSLDDGALPGVQWDFFQDYAKPYDPKADDTVASLAQLFRTISSAFLGAIAVTTRSAFGIMDYVRQKLLPPPEGEKSGKAQVQHLATRFRVTELQDREVNMKETTEMISVDGTVRQIISRATTTETAKPGDEEERRKLKG